VRPWLKIVFITLGAMVVVYGAYLLSGRPAIPLPAYHMQVDSTNQLYPIVKATESGEVKLTLVTSGRIVASADGKELANIRYTPTTLQNALDVVSPFMPPLDPESSLGKLTNTLPFTRKVPMFLVEALYHVVRFQFSVIVSAN